MNPLSSRDTYYYSNPLYYTSTKLPFDKKKKKVMNQIMYPSFNPTGPSIE